MPKRTLERLTEKSIRELAPRAVRYEVKDGAVPGLCVVVYPSGKRSFCYRYGSKQERRYTLTESTLEAARRRAGKLATQVDDGLDPVRERRGRRAMEIEKREAERLAAERKRAIAAGTALPGTLAELAERYLKAVEHGRGAKRLRPRSLAEVARHLDFAKAAWGQREARSIGRRDVIALVEQYRERAAESGRHEDAGRRGIVPAARLLAALSALFSYAARRDEIPANPARGMKRADFGLEELPRDRVLSEVELRAVWQALPRVNALHSAALRLVLLTALRPGEVLALRWSDLERDSHGHFLHLASERTKSGEGRRVPLSAQALAVLEEARALPYESRYVFASGGKAGHVCHLSHPTARVVELARVPRFTPHDLRRTARTLLSSLGVRREVSERLVGHAVGSKVEQTYDRHSYDAEQLEAAQLLGAHVESIVNPGERTLAPVLPLQRRRR